MFESNLNQLITCPTHIRGNTLDILLTNCDHLISNISVTKPDDHSLPSNHYLISFLIECSSLSTKSNVPVFIFDYPKADYEGLCNFLFDTDFSYSLQSDFIEQVWSFLKDTILEGMNRFIPKVRASRRNHPIWFSPEIRHTLRCLRTQKKKCSKRPTLNNQSKLKSLECRLSELMISAKLHFEQSLSSQSSSKIFSYIKSLSSTTSVPPIVFLDSSTGCDKVSLFNTFFHSVFTHSEFQIPPLEELPVPAYSLSDIGISELDVFEILSTLDASKAMGFDGIGPKVLKHCALALYKPLHHLFLLSLSQHYLPSDWRTHLIVPVFKSGDKSSVCNYRPISLLCTVSKVLEKLIYNKIIHFISASICPSQFGFRPKHSSTQQLLIFLSSIQDSLASNSQADVIYLDFKKAFDSVSHNELLVKLWSLGMTRNMWKWFQAYLSCRSQHVRLNQCISDPLPVISGVPQGSILGPLLFLIFVNDIPSSIKHSHVFLFADDAKCLKKISSSSDCHSLQDDLSRLSIWSLRWNLHFNENKCVVFRFCSKLPHVLFDYTLTILQFKFSTAIEILEF